MNKIGNLKLITSFDTHNEVYNKDTFNILNGSKIYLM